MTVVKFNLAFMNQRQSRLLNFMLISTMECLSSWVYFHSIKKILHKGPNEQWFISTQNAYYDSIISNWCKLFGTNSEPVHYKNLVEHKYAFEDELVDLGIDPVNPVNLKQYLLKAFNIDKNEFDDYRRSTCEYRNEALLHPVHDPDVLKDKKIKYPKTEMAIKTAYPLYKLLINILSTFPDLADSRRNYRVRYPVFSSKDQLISYLKGTFPKFNGAISRN